MFKKAEGETPRAKLFVYGGAGSGKTVFGMRWSELGGKLAVMDNEGGTHRYDREFEFHRFEPKNMSDVKEAIRWLGSESHDFTTLMIDPVTIMWDWHQQQWEEEFLRSRNPANAGHYGGRYEFQPGDWRLVKQDWKRIFYLLRQLDMNVIATARAKAEYATGGEMMQRIGDTFDAEKGTNYEMDTALHFKKLANDERVAQVIKHRSYRKKMPNQFSIETMDVIVDHFGDAISRKAVPIEYITEESKEEMTRLLDFLGIEIEKRRKALKQYSVTRAEDLTQKQADEILIKLRKKSAKVTPF